MNSFFPSQDNSFADSKDRSRFGMDLRMKRSV